MNGKPVVLMLLCGAILFSRGEAQTESTSAAALEPAAPSRPQEPIELRVQKTQKLSVEQAVQIALDNSTAIQIAKLQVEQAKARVRAAEARLYPNFSLSVPYAYSQSASTKFSIDASNVTGSSPGGGVIFRIDSTILQPSLNANWTIFSFGANEAQVEATVESLKSAELTLQAQIQTIKLSVIQNYYDFQQQNANVKIAESALRNAQASLKDAQAQEKAGVGTRFDTLRSEVQVANAEQQLVGSRNSAVVAQRNLAALLNFVVPTEIVVDDVQQNGNWDLGLEESIFRAINARPELEQLLAQQRSNEATQRASQLSLLPSLTLNSSYNLYNNFNLVSFGFKDGYSIGATLTWNFYDGGAASANAEAARRGAQINIIQFQDTKNSIRFAVESALFTNQSSAEQIKSSKKGQDLAEESLRLARLRFRAGVGTQTDVIAAENALTQAQGNLVNAVISYNRSLAQLRRALNVL